MDSSRTMMENGKLALCVLFFQLALCWAFAMFVDYTGESIGPGLENESGPIRGTHPRKHLSSIYYYMFQDVHLMAIIGFGLTVTFLKRYGCRSVTVNLLVAVITLQWAILCQGIFHAYQGKLRLSIINMVNADFALVAVLISFGAVVDLTTPLQLIVMATCEIPLFITNEHISLEILQVSDVGESMLVHVFGAYFGLMVSYVMQTKTDASTDEKENVVSDGSFLLIGTIILWLLWPALNASFAEGDAQHRAILNSYYSLAASAVVTFSITSFLEEKYHWSMVNIQNSALAGGVAIGTAADMMIQPFGAMIVGVVAAIVTLSGFLFIAPWMNRKVGIKDPCGVHNLHGLAGLVSSFVGAVVAAVATETDYHYNLYRIFPARSPLNSTSDYWNVRQITGDIKPGSDRSGTAQGAYQIAGLGVTLVVALVGGLITGLILRLPIFHQKEENSVPVLPIAT